jgi:hypothetical protein
LTRGTRRPAIELRKYLPVADRVHLSGRQYGRGKGGLALSKGAKLNGFAIAGENHAFVWAEAHIDGDAVLVSSPQITTPVAVRYAWGDDPVCNLANRAGLPAVPFRTDDWPGTTWPRAASGPH